VARPERQVLNISRGEGTENMGKEMKEVDWGAKKKNLKHTRFPLDSSELIYNYRRKI